MGNIGFRENSAAGCYQRCFSGVIPGTFGKLGYCDMEAFSLLLDKGTCTSGARGVYAVLPVYAVFIIEDEGKSFTPYRKNISAAGD